MIAALLLAQAIVGPALDSGTPREIVKLGWDARAKLCSAAVHGSEVGDPRTDDGQAAIVAALPDMEKVVHLLGTTSVPYACVQGALDALQKSGRRYSVGFGPKH